MSNIIFSKQVLYVLDTNIDSVYKYCWNLLKANSSLDRIRKQFSIMPTFLFYGLPGTGKTTVANLVYEKLKTNSDTSNIDLYYFNIEECLSSSFGESSRNILNFFANIEDNIKENNSFAFVIIDELDSFAINRFNNDSNSIQRVLTTFNKIINQYVKEDKLSKIVLVATTNLLDTLDTSILRRFFFHINFDKCLCEKEFIDYLRLINDSLCVIHEETDDAQLFKELFAEYNKQKHTLGEIKRILAQNYIANLCGCNTVIPSIIEAFKQPTFYSLNCIQKSEKTRRG